MASALAGCASSPPVHYYTLLQGSAQGAASQSGTAMLIDLTSVTVAPQSDQPQLMVRDASGAVAALYSDRWTSPLADELRIALADHLVRTLGAIDVQTVKPGPSAPVWRIQVDVRRFDSIAGKEALVESTWRVRPVNFQAPMLLCSTRVTVPVSGSDAQAIVNAHQQAAAQLALTIASALRAGGRSAQPASAQVQMLGCTQLAPQIE